MTLQTVRRDVQRLSEAGLLARFHGGVRLPSSTTENIAYRQRQALQADGKARIARAVAQRVPAGCSLILNIGTTPEAVARELLHHQGLRVITNNLNVAAILSDNPDCEVIVAGGVVRARDRGIIGEATVDFIRQFKVDIGLIGISGIEEDGSLRDYDYREVKVARAIIEQSRQVWMVADHTKFNRPAMVHLARMDEIDMLYTDGEPPGAFSAADGRGRRGMRGRRLMEPPSSQALATLPQARGPPADGPAEPAPSRELGNAAFFEIEHCGDFPWPTCSPLTRAPPAPAASSSAATGASPRWRNASSARSIRSPAGSSTIRRSCGPASWPPRRRCCRAPACRPRRSRAIGITNQRETTLVWHRGTGLPIYNAIVWQDRRAEPTCAEMRAQGLSETVQAKTGLRIDAYFSATKLKWILDHVDGAREMARRGELAFGTVDTWLVWQLTEGRVHATDVSNASRTMLFNIHTGQWDDELLAALDIPRALMPEVKPSSAHFGDTAAAGRHAAHRGHRRRPAERALRPGLLQGRTRQEHLRHRLLHADAHRPAGPVQHQRPDHDGLLHTAGPTREYATEGSVFIGGAVVQWLRDGLRAISASSEVQALAESVPDAGRSGLRAGLHRPESVPYWHAGGVMLVPAFTGLGAPYWQPEARGSITGLTRGTTMAHIARAALESIAFQSAALLDAMSRDAVAAGGVPVSELRVDGGACVNDLLMQIQADLLGIPVVRPAVVETTALGAAYLAGLQCGLYEGLDELSAQWRAERTFIRLCPGPTRRAGWRPGNTPCGRR